MARMRAYKVALLSELEQNVATQKSIVLLTTNGTQESITSEMNSDLRKKAMESGVRLQIIKNTLTRRLFDDVPELQGQTYVGYLKDGSNSDEIGVPKALVQLVKSKEFENSLSIVGAVVNGEFIDAAKTETLSKTPSREDSFAMAAGAINSIASKLAQLAKEIPSKIARATSEVAKSKA